MQKKVLSEIDLYQGYVSMPENFEINIKEIQMSIFSSYVKNDTKVEKYILPIGDGVTVCRKI